MSKPTVSYSKDGIATISLNRPKTLNALTREDYDELGELLRQVDQREDVSLTLLQASGRFFCAGTDVTRSYPIANTERQHFLNGAAHSHTDISRALYSHSKVLVAALNGPVMGITAALLGQFDFIYAVPEVWFSTPFSLLGLNSEGGASATFLDRMGPAKAKEALLFGQKLTSSDLLECGFINKIFPSKSTEEFHKEVRAHLLYQLKDLDVSAMLASKRLLQQATRDRGDPDAVNLREGYSQAQRTSTGVPATRFGKVARREIKHKL